MQLFIALHCSLSFTPLLHLKKKSPSLHIFMVPIMVSRNVSRTILRLKTYIKLKNQWADIQMYQENGWNLKNNNPEIIQWLSDDAHVGRRSKCKRRDSQRALFWNVHSVSRVTLVRGEQGKSHLEKNVLLNLDWNATLKTKRIKKKIFTQLKRLIMILIQRWPLSHHDSHLIHLPDTHSRTLTSIRSLTSCFLRSPPILAARRTHAPAHSLRFCLFSFPWSTSFSK